MSAAYFAFGFSFKYFSKYVHVTFIFRFLSTT